MNWEDVKGMAWTYVKDNPTYAEFLQDIWWQPVLAIATYLRHLVPMDVMIIEEKFLSLAVC